MNRTADPIPEPASPRARRNGLVRTIGRSLGALVLKRRFPLIVGWNVTHRCNLQCTYCRIREVATPEIDTAEALRLVDEFAGLGTRYVSLLGGEPLLREDLHQIVRRCVDRGLHVGIDTNGTLVPRRLATVRLASRIQVSLDGPPAINDAVRGRGAHTAAVRAIELCRNERVPVEINAVVSRGGEEAAPYLLDLADRFGIGVYFQPADPTLAGCGEGELPLSPDPERFRSAVEYLIDEKRQGRRSVLNTTAGLRHLAHWAAAARDRLPPGPVLLRDRARRRPESLRQRTRIPVAADFHRGRIRVSVSSTPAAVLVSPLLVCFQGRREPDHRPESDVLAGSLDTASHFLARPGDPPDAVIL